MQATTTSQKENAMFEELNAQVIEHDGIKTTVGNLRDTFQEITRTMKNWKHPITFVMNGNIETIGIYQAAITFHVGGPNRIEVLAKCDNGSMTVRITNKGYYANIGA